MTGETKEYYFEEFRKAYHWEDGMEVRVKEAWHTKASKSYSDILSKAKGNNKKPKYVQENIWEKWNGDWQGEEAQRLIRRIERIEKEKMELVHLATQEVLSVVLSIGEYLKNSWVGFLLMLSFFIHSY